MTRDATWSTAFDRSLAISGGRVRCPRRGEVDVEVCARCTHLLALEGDGAARIVCAWPYDVGRQVRRELGRGRRWAR